jgi:hypothetical protein
VRIDDCFRRVRSCGSLHQSSLIFQREDVATVYMMLGNGVRVTSEDLYNRMDVHHYRLNDVSSKRRFHQNQYRHPVAAAMIPSLDITWRDGVPDALVELACCHRTHDHQRQEYPCARASAGRDLAEQGRVLTSSFSFRYAARFSRYCEARSSTGHTSSNRASIECFASI